MNSGWHGPRSCRVNDRSRDLDPGRAGDLGASNVGSGRDRRVPLDQRRPVEADVNAILDAILSGSATAEDFAAIPVPA